ncbi:hypothetical protein ACQKEY_07415 [Lysinibacillus fusiformis]
MVGFALLKLESTQWNFTAVMKQLLFQDNIPQMIGLRLLQFTKMLPINTKGVVSHERGCPLSNCWTLSHELLAVFFVAKIMLVYIAVYYASKISNNKSKNFSKSLNSIVKNLKNQKGEGSLWRKSIQ